MLGKIIRKEIFGSRDHTRKAQTKNPDISSRDAKIKDLTDLNWLDSSRGLPGEEFQDHSTDKESPPFTRYVPVSPGLSEGVEDPGSFIEEMERDYKVVKEKRKLLGCQLRDLEGSIRKKAQLTLNHELIDLPREMGEGIKQFRARYLRSVFEYEPRGYLNNLLIEHALNVAFLAVVIGFEMKYDKDDLFHIFLSGVFHDIGLFKIDPKIINKPSSLNLHEKKLLSVHPIEGAKLFERLCRSSTALVPDADLISKIITQEHERVNGTGYPYRLREGEMHPFAMILGISDTIESLTHPRPYRKPMLPFQAFRRIYLNEKERFLFARGIRRACFAGITPYPPGIGVDLNTGDRATVVDSDPWWPLNPVILIRHVGKDNMKIYHHVIDLRKNNLIHINHDESRY